MTSTSTTQAGAAIADYHGQRGGFSKLATKLGAAQEKGDLFFGEPDQYHFPDGSTAMAKQRGPHFDLWESGLGSLTE